MSFTRRDTQHANPEHRPTQAQYERFIWLVQRFRDLGWDNTKLHDASPFQLVDPGFNGILLRSCADLARLADKFGETSIAQASRARVEKGVQALESLWSEEHSQYLCWDRVAKAPVKSPSIAGLLAAFASIPKDRAAIIAQRISKIHQHCRFLVPSHDPQDGRFDARRYWRGPVWLIVNYMIANGLAMHGQNDIAKAIIANSLELIETGGFAEYYDPIDGSPCGGASFSWTAAMVIEFLHL